MNPKTFLTLSLVANLSLAGALIWSARQKHTGQNTGVAAASTVAATTSEKPTAARAAATARSPAIEAFKSDQQFNWRTVESEDYKKYIANLRAIGCPEETIRDIITADVNKLFENRAKGMSGVKTNRYEYWKGGMQMFSKMFDEEKIKARQALAKEKRALLTELLGVAPEEKPDMMAMFGGANPFEEMLDFLTPGQQMQIMELEQKYAGRLMKAVGNMDGDGMKEMAKVQKEKEAELAKLLSPQEFEDYQLRMSQTSMMLRMQMGSFEPSEDEFKAIFREKKKFEDEFGMAGMGATDKADREKMKTAEAAMKETLKTTLGDRYAEYELSQDQAYQSIYRVTERNGLGKDSAKKVYDMKKEAETQASALRKDTSLTKEQRDAALKGIRDETENAMKTVLGDKGYTSYEKQAWWLNGISSKPKPADE